MLDIQAREQLRKEKKQARLQALQGQALEDLPKEGYGATRPPTAHSSSAHTSISTSTVSIPAIFVAPTVAATPSPSSQPHKRAADPIPQKAQPPSWHRHLVDEHTDEEVEVSEDLNAPWQHDDFVMPENRIDCLLMAKKIGVVDTLEKINIRAYEGPQVVAGWGILQRVAQMDMGSEFMGLSSGYLANRTGLLVTELATNVVALDNLVSYHRGLKEEAEARLSQRVDDLNSTSADLSRVLTKFENVSTELKATSDKLLEVSEELSAEKLSSEKLNAHLATTEQELALTQGREAQSKGQLAAVSKEAVITEDKASDDFTMDWMDKVLPYYDQGKFHVIRMAVASGASSFQLFKWGEVEHYSEAPRAFHNVVPYSDEDLEMLKQREPHWSLPLPLAQNIPYLLKVIRCGGCVEMTPSGWLVELAGGSR